MQNTGKTPLRNFRDLVVWQKAHAISLRIYGLSEKFPSSEQFALCSQMRRAAVSITSNIAEGFGRVSARDKQHFCVMAIGSTRELQSQISLAKDLLYIDEAEFLKMDNDLEEVLRMLNSLKNSQSNLSS